MYTFEHRKTKKVKEVSAPMAEYKELEDEMNKLGWHRVYEPLTIVGGLGNRVMRGADEGWKDVLRQIKTNSGKKSTIDV
jgi:hypothetical protein